MKYYIVLQPSIHSMGGEEMYTRNILLSARENGFTPVVLHSDMAEDKIYIDDLKPFEKYGIPEFRYEPCVVSKRRKGQLLKRLENILQGCESESVVESHEILVAEWGEWMAEKLKIRHFAYMLLEHNTLTFRSLYDFFRFKYDRHELAGIVKETIPDMFKHYASDIIGYSLPAYCTNTYEDIPCREEHKVKTADFTIGSLGRTNKQYVLPMVDAFVNFVQKHSQKTFNILYVGGSMDKLSEKEVVRRLSSLPNAHLIFTGMLFPIPIELVRQMDVCVATAGSCFVSYNCGVPTISVDGNDSKAIGIYGKTTRNTLFRSDKEPQIDIEDLLEEILMKRKYEKEDRLELVNVDFSSQWKFIDEMSKKQDYFDISKINYPLRGKLLSLFLGFYYGLSSKSILRKFFAKVISLTR